MVPPGWYVTRAGGRGEAGAGLLAGLEVNSLDTWDLARLGWLKVGREGQGLYCTVLYTVLHCIVLYCTVLKVARGGRGLVSHNLGQLARSFQPSVDTCSGPAGARVSHECCGHCILYC